MKKITIVLLTLSLVSTHFAFGTLTKEDGRQKRRKNDYNKTLTSLQKAKKQKRNYQGKKVERLTKQCKQLRSQITKTNRAIYEIYEQNYSEY